MPFDEGALARLARSQHGVLTYQQALALSSSRAAIVVAVRTGRWAQPTRGIYVLAGYPRSVEQRAMIATLARPGSAVARLTAAHLRGWVDTSPRRPHLVVPRSATSRSTIATITRADVPSDHLEVIGAIPIASAPWTIVDLAKVLGPKRLTQIVDRALHRRHTTVAAISAVLDGPRAVSTARRSALLEILDAWGGPIRPGSIGEARLVRTIVSWGHPRPEHQVEIVDASGTVIARADGGWTGRRIVFEYDGLEFHGPLRWASDEARHEAIEALGYRLLHADKVDLVPGERSFRDQLAQAWAETEPDRPLRGLPPGA